MTPKKHNRFTIDCRFDIRDAKEWFLLEPFFIDVVVDGRETEIEIPAGFNWDGASVPRLFQNVFPKWGKYAVASLVHDWLYANNIGKRREADRIFLHLMSEAGVNWLGRHIMYLAVRLFGGAVWYDD